MGRGNRGRPRFFTEVPSPREAHATVLKVKETLCC